MSSQFVNTDRFKTLVSSLYQYEEPAAAAPEEPKAAAALLEKKGDMSRSYLTVSQAANDKHQQHTQLATGVTGAVH
jgi:hypothetical protein